MNSNSYLGKENGVWMFGTPSASLFPVSLDPILIADGGEMEFPKNTLLLLGIPAVIPSV